MYNQSLYGVVEAFVRCDMEHRCTPKDMQGADGGRQLRDETHELRSDEGPPVTTYLRNCASPAVVCLDHLVQDLVHGIHVGRNVTFARQWTRPAT